MIAASLEAGPADAPVVVRLLCDGPDHELGLATPGDLDLQKKIAAMPAPRLCLCGRVLSDEELVRANVDTTPSTCEYQCAECGQVSVFPYTPPAAPADAFNNTGKPMLRAWADRVSMLWSVP